MDKPPFGFRKEAEEKPEPEADNEQEISCTSLHESKVWTPAVQARVTTTDGDTWRLR